MAAAVATRCANLSSQISKISLWPDQPAIVLQNLMAVACVVFKILELEPSFLFEAWSVVMAMMTGSLCQGTPAPLVPHGISQVAELS